MIDKEFIKEYLAEYFAILEEFFSNLTKKQAHEFATFDDISKKIRTFFQDIMMSQKDSADDRLQSLEILEDKLLSFYSENAHQAFQAAKELDGLKLCIPGNRSFGRAQFDAVKAGLVFSNTVLIPDPIFPWIDEERKGDKHRLANILKEAFSILQLKPLLSEDVPAILIFPIAEDTFSLSNPVNKKMLESLITDFSNSYFDESILEYSQVIEFVRENPDKFLEKVEEEKLFIPFGARLNDPIDRMLIRYKDEVAERKDKKESRQILSLPKHEIILKAISERLQAQLHLLTFINNLRANFLLSLEVQGHYFSLLRKTILRKLFIAKSLKKDAFLHLSTINSQKITFVKNMPLKALIEFRKAPALLVLRRKLADIMDSMKVTGLEKVVLRTSKQVAELARVCLEFKDEINSMNSNVVAFYLKKDNKAPMETEINIIPVIAPFMLSQVPYNKASKYFEENKLEWIRAQISSESILGVSITE